MASFAALGLVTTATPADTPLPPPEDYRREVDGATVLGDATRNTTTIRQSGGDSWTIPVWARAFLLAPDATSILVLGDGLNLIALNDPEVIVATVWYLEGASVLTRPVTLGEVMDPADLVRTASHWLWLGDLELAETGYRLRLSDGRTVILTFR